MKRSLPAAAALVLLTTLAIPTATQAADHKMYHGSDCKVFGATAWTDLAFSGYGVKNLASSARNIICPLTKDSEIGWDANNALALASIRLHVETGPVAASYTCTVYVTTMVDTSSVNTVTISSGPKPPNTLSEHYAASFQSVVASPGSSYDKAYMLCTLGPQVRLIGYSFYEAGYTQY